MTYTVTEHDGRDILPWFQPESAGAVLEVGTRLYTFSDYNSAPKDTRVRMGRKNGSGEIMIKQGSAWESEEGGPRLTAYGMENRPSYVI